MPKIRSHYDNLTVAKNASPRVIKAAYKALCQAYHPDKFEGGREEAERIMKIINAAYEILSDPLKRAEHDAWLAANESQADSTYSPGNGMEKRSDHASGHHLHYRMVFRWPFLLPIGAALLLGFFIGSASLTDSGEGAVTYRQPEHESVAAEKATLKAVEDETVWNSPNAVAPAPLPAEAAGQLDTGEKSSGTPALPENFKDKQGKTDLGGHFEAQAALPADPLMLKEMAKYGNARAQFVLAMMHFRKLEYSQAVFWWRKAAERGDAAAQYHLGYLYSKGDGVAKDQNRALYWYRKAAEQGYANAQYHMGLIYVSEPSMKRDYYKGIYWLRKAAQQGHGDALQLLSMQDQSAFASNGKLSASMPQKCIIKPVMSDEDFGNCAK